MYLYKITIFGAKIQIIQVNPLLIHLQIIALERKNSNPQFLVFSEKLIFWTQFGILLQCAIHYPDLKARPLKTHCVPMVTSNFSGIFCWGAVDANVRKGIKNRRNLILNPRRNDNCEEDSCLAYTLFENHSKCRISILDFSTFLSISNWPLW